ncbi:unnamed protein product [Camellia sinensis]
MFRINKFFGVIPPLIGSLSKLIYLDLSTNQFSGNIPPEIGLLTNLETLHLFDNQLNGSIPQKIGQLKFLIELALYTNSLSDPMPTSLTNLRNLIRLYLYGNDLSSSIPPEMGNLVNLVELYMDGNNLTGPIPSTLGNLNNLTLKSLQSLTFQTNDLTSSIPTSLVMDENQFSGNLSELCQGGYVWLGKHCKGTKICVEMSRLAALQNSFCIAHTHSRKRTLVLIIVLSLGGALLLLGAFIGLLIVFNPRKRKSQVEEGNTQPPSEDLLSISIFNRRAMYSSCEELHLLSKRADQKDFLNEVWTLTEIKHQNIVKLFGFCSHARHSFLVYEYLERGSLAIIFNKDEEAKELDWPKRVNIIKGVVSALSYKNHDCTLAIVHRDISSNNVLVDEEYEACVSDFGIAKLLKLDFSNWSVFAGIYGYVAPDLAYTTKVTEKCDIYSFGLLALEVIKGKHPGDFITSLLTPTAENIKLTEVLDQCLSPLSPEVEEVVMCSVKLSICMFACQSTI